MSAATTTRREQIAQRYERQIVELVNRSAYCEMCDRITEPLADGRCDWCNHHATRPMTDAEREALIAPHRATDHCWLLDRLRVCEEALTEAHRIADSGIEWGERRNETRSLLRALARHALAALAEHGEPT